MNQNTISVNFNQIIKADMLSKGLVTSGMVAGVITGIARKSGVWGTCGWILIGGIAGGAVAAVINSTKNNYITNNN